MASLFQFSIRGLLYAVTFLAVGIAALLNANGLWQGLVWGLSLYALVAAILLIVYRRQEKRSFWLGFTVFGWSYVALCLIAQFPAITQTWYRSDPLKYEQLFATQAAHFVHQHVLPESRRLEYINVQVPQGGNDASIPGGPPGMGGGGDMAMMTGMMGSAGGPMGPGGGISTGGGPGVMTSGMMGGMGPPSFVQAPNPQYIPLNEFTQIFHAIVLLLVAAIGGKTCELIYRTRPSTEE